jgi:hypothetical protein
MSPSPSGSSRSRPSVTICGSGNAAHALAVVASQNLDVDIDWLAGSGHKADLLRAAVSARGLHSTGVITASADRLRTISADPAQVIPSADLVMIVVPAFAHAAVLSRITPYLGDRTVIACMPARGGFEFQAAQLASRHRATRPTICGLQTLPWSTRVVSFGEAVHIGAVKSEVVLAALPANDGPELAARLSALLGTQVVATESFISLTLGNPGQLIHPGLMYGHFRRWGGEEYDEDSVPMLYAGATDEIGEVVEGLSSDVMTLARELGAQRGDALDLERTVLPIHEWLRTVYGQVTTDTSTVGACFRTGPIRARKAPMIESRPGKFVPNFEYRYLSEDVPFGLVVTRALAGIANVETPTINEVIEWAQRVLHKIYLVGEELEGPDVRELRIPQNHGVSTLADLIGWYRDGTAAAVSPPPGDASP